MPARPPRIPRPALRALAGLGAFSLVALLGYRWWQQQVPIPDAIGIDMPLTAGGAIDPSDKNTADLYMEEHPGR